MPGGSNDSNSDNSNLHFRFGIFWILDLHRLYYLYLHLLHIGFILHIYIYIYINQPPFTTSVGLELSTTSAAFSTPTRWSWRRGQQTRDRQIDRWENGWIFELSMDWWIERPVCTRLYEHIDCDIYIYIIIYIYKHILAYDMTTSPLMSESYWY